MTDPGKCKCKCKNPPTYMTRHYLQPQCPVSASHTENNTDKKTDKTKTITHTTHTNEKKE
jgi:hypothetical protein